MSNAIYPKFKEACLNATLNGADIEAILIDDADYT